MIARYQVRNSIKMASYRISACRQHSPGEQLHAARRTLRSIVDGRICPVISRFRPVAVIPLATGRKRCRQDNRFRIKQNFAYLTHGLHKLVQTPIDLCMMRRQHTPKGFYQHYGVWVDAAMRVSDTQSWLLGGLGDGYRRSDFAGIKHKNFRWRITLVLAVMPCIDDFNYGLIGFQM